MDNAKLSNILIMVDIRAKKEKRYLKTKCWKVSKYDKNQNSTLLSPSEPQGKNYTKAHYNQIVKDQPRRRENFKSTWSKDTCHISEKKKKTLSYV